MGLENFQVSEATTYASLFDKYKEGPVEVPPGHKTFGVIIKPVTGALKLYVLKDNKSACVFCSLSYSFLFVCDKVAADHFKDEIIPSRQEKERIQFAINVSMNHTREKGKQRFKFSYKLFKEQDGYYPFIDTYPFTTLINLKEFPCGIQHCVTVVGKWVLTEIFHFLFLSLLKIWTTIALIITRQE